tara:strand:+ start:1437 stop:1739 length:303 start_codon:yes stop_codon:yes gene_type:complete
MSINIYKRKVYASVKREVNDEDKRQAYYMPKSKAKVFEKLFNRVALMRGGKGIAMADLKLADSTMAELRKGSLTKETAAKILDGYNKYVKNYLNGGIISN